jgi:hypothetical protein
VLALSKVPILMIRCETLKLIFGFVIGVLNDNKTTLTTIKTLIERFANSTSTDDFFDALNEMYRHAEQDPELRRFFKDANKFIRKCLQEQGFVLQDQANTEWNELYDRGQFLLRDRYRNDTDRLLDEIKFIGHQFDEDPQNKAFADAVQKLFLDLGNDENGQPKFKKHLVKDLTEVIIPGIFENTRYVPIPRIEVSDPMVDVVVENLVVESDNLFPNVIEFGSDNYWRLGRKQIKNKHDNKVMISASGVQCDLRDVSYYIKKKQGFPSITDKGVMDIILGGEGFSFKIAARNAHKKDRTHFIAIDKVDVEVKNLQIKLKQSNHKLLFGIAKPLLLKVMRPAIQKAISKQIQQSFEQADQYAWGIHQEAQKGLNAAKNDPENAPAIYQHYLNAIKSQATAKKEKAEQAAERAKKTDVNLAVTQNDSMFKNISLPGGISTKATEYQQLAAKGDKWESPVFSIGSAKESTDIPKLAQVTRKPHNTRQSGLRGATSANTGAYGSNTGAYGGASTGAGAGAGLGNQMDRAFEPTKPLGDVTNGGANPTNVTSGTYYDSATTQQ